MAKKNELSDKFVWNSGDIVWDEAPKTSKKKPANTKTPKPSKTKSPPKTESKK